ncbi:helix-turn-helix transcriptional regulator [Streptosporangium sp. NPDC020072]|uniref:helix-turn-helix domain-containing protein n=1 Tax=Streptosporangium sp. NPDC020072 TaxID=3154788 RepID=UPI0034285689
MANEDTPAIRIAQARKHRGLTQEGLALKINVSRSLLAHVERGAKPASQALIGAVARVCGVDVAWLQGQPYEPLDGLIPPLRRALSHPSILPPPDVPPRPLPTLVVELRRLQRMQEDTDHTALGAALPSVLEELVATATEIGTPQGYRALNHGYAIAASLARRLGYFDLAQVALDRASWAADRADNPDIPGLVVLGQSLLMLTVGSSDIALNILRPAIARVDTSTPEGLSVLGALRLRAAIAAARMGHAGEAWEHHGIATEAAERVTQVLRRDPYGAEVTPANTAIHGCAVATELGDPDEAIRRDSGLVLPQHLYAERRAHHDLDMSRALLLAGSYQKAASRLVRAGEIAPQMTRFHPAAMETHRHIRHHLRRDNPTLRRLDRIMGEGAARM